MAPADLTELTIARMHSLYNTITRRVGISVRVRGWAAATKPDESKRHKSGVQLVCLNFSIWVDTAESIVRTYLGRFMVGSFHLSAAYSVYLNE